MSLLSMCQDAADEIGLQQPTSIVSNAGSNERKLLRYAQSIGHRLMKLYPWQILRAEVTFTSVAQALQTSILPSDWDRMIPETFWDRSNNRLIAGPIGPVQWQGLQGNSTYLEYNNSKFALRGSNIYIVPTPSAGDTYAYEYIKNTWAAASGGAAQTAFAADTDTTVFDEELMTLGIIFRFLDSEGLPAQNAYANFDEHLQLVTASDNPDVAIMSAGDIFTTYSRHDTGEPPANQTVDTVY